MTDKWDLWHDFDRAANNGLVDPIYCPHDGFPLYLQSDEDMEPVLRCYHCGGIMVPGSKVTAQVRELLESI